MRPSLHSWALERASSLRVWEGHGKRAPNKPLLLLWALGHYSRGGARMIPFAEADPPLKRLLAEFGPPRTVHHTEYPFWYLRSDELWEVTISPAEEGVIEQAGYPTKGALLRGKAQGGVPEPLYRALRRSESFLAAFANAVVEPAFPASLAEDLLDAVGLNLPGPRRHRDPAFRTRVLSAYEYRCAICGFDARLGTAPAGLEAAHIMWHQAGGADSEENGLALCTLHHKLFDRGGITLSREGAVLISENLHGTGSFSNFVLAYHGAKVREPLRDAYRPAMQNVEWHWEQVFRGPARVLA